MITTEIDISEDHSGYLLYHSIGLYPNKAVDMAAALSEFSAGFSQADTGHWERILPLRQAFIDHWRTLINAPEGSLTTSENVTSAVHAVITSLPVSALEGRRVLIAADCFPSLHFLLTGLAPRLGFTLDTVPLRTGEHWVREDDFMGRWTPEVGLALLTWVTSTASHRSDLDRLVAHGRRHDSLIGVDITQAVGLLPFDVQQPGVDFTVSTSLKWLCGTPGAGILHLAPALLARCQPELRGWFSQADIFAWDLEHFRYAPDARRFDNGTPSIVPCLASLPALRWHAEQDTDSHGAHNRALCAHLAEGLHELGANVVSPEDPDQRGGSIMIELDSALDPSKTIRQLERHRLAADHRGQILRFSPGHVTTPDGIERLLDVLETILT